MQSLCALDEDNERLIEKQGCIFKGEDLVAPPVSQIIEAVLFAHAKPLTLAELGKLSGAEKTEVKKALEELSQFYAKHNRAFCLEKTANGYLLHTLAAFQPWIVQAKEIKPLRLSVSALETLSVVAYKQPITKAEVEEVRGVDASYALKSLLDKGLIRIQGKKDIPGRPLIYGTSKLFLEVFGFQKLQDLPLPEDFDLLESTATPQTLEPSHEEG